MFHFPLCQPSAHPVHLSTSSISDRSLTRMYAHSKNEAYSYEGTLLIPRDVAAAEPHSFPPSMSRHQRICTPARELEQIPSPGQESDKERMACNKWQVIFRTQDSKARPSNKRRRDRTTGSTQVVGRERIYTSDGRLAWNPSQIWCERLRKILLCRVDLSGGGVDS